MTSLIGLGTDIIEIERVKRASENSKGRFIKRIFTPGEISVCTGRRNPWPCFAARFAAKEAVFKALGTGLTSWHEVEITGGGNQPVQVTLTGAAKRAAREKGIVEVMLTISHDHGRAVAFATAINRR